MGSVCERTEGGRDKKKIQKSFALNNVLLHFGCPCTLTN